ncbi:MAG: hypothetical protein EOO61_08940 [Hymenobacter sp.]|nr:MAG: hypothetical protein EOO61_08940 [Hymenobacter sp.]
MKIGQFPSIADISKDETKRYKSILPNEYYVELNKAIGLYSHGIGIGSFVYMRRIFEKLIFDTFDEVKEEIEIDYKAFVGLKMADKIGSLSDYLPRTLVEKKALYSVLSKGIHELDENTCKESFPIVRAGIEFILDEKITQIQRKAKEDKFNKDFELLLNKIK